MLSHLESRTGFALNKSVVTHCSEAGVAVEVGLMQGFSGHLHVESHGLWPAKNLSFSGENECIYSSDTLKACVTCSESPKVALLFRGR